jgi:copper chaperone NosL
MTISDNRFGAEIVTKKGKIYKFDDAHCVKAFMSSKKVGQADIAGTYFTDFIPPHQLVNAEQAYFLQSPKLKSPMNGNIAAFSQEDSLTQILPQFPGFKITWEEAQK